MTARIFISYRRKDAIAEARAVFERLRADFGDEQVFIDLEGMDYGDDYVDALESQLAHCRVMLVLLGPQWLDARDAKGQRRIDNDSDPVRLELRAALARPEVKLVPLLIDGTEIPAEDDMPADLRPMLRRQAMNLRFDSFDADMRYLATHLKPMLAAAAPPAAAVPPSSPTAGPVRAELPSPSPAGPAWACDVGRDDYGRWAEFELDDVVQRLRWVEAGEFLIGSTASEAERFKNEGPQHAVRITRSFWMADTACTQALWLAVMGGKNPAFFPEDPQNPVEQVSHEDAERFLALLSDELGADVAAVLPNEAEWEYACRAGTTTAFFFGPNITPKQVNYDGDIPYANGAKGRYRQRTVPVKALPCNGWGLYQMHGNVWEWCADDQRDYADALAGRMVEDPVGPREAGPEAYRGLRGGSWVCSGLATRSACRFRYPRNKRSLDVGFRLVLRD
jgi:formylglycine-generating enzyme